MLRLDLNLVWTIINMLIIYAIYRKFLYQPVHKVLDARQAEIDKQYADAETARQSAEQLKEQAQAEMTEISRKKADMLGEARQKAGEEYDRLMKQAKEQAEQIVTDARARSKWEQDKQMEEAKRQIADLVMAATAKRVADKTGEEEHRKLYQQFLTKTGGMER